ncbi:MAG TPA: tetratricopeptide repeat protein, partial [Flavisolibacter sp.]|nr:tetratricopeptide repeat protein [Flavisolibacter sp.]
MLQIRYTLSLLFSLVLLAVAQPLCAQLGFDLDIKKPEPYENRELKAEKTGDKKLKAPRRFMQNMTTHYNYFFNANARLNEIIDRAKSSQKDDYSLLLPFYNYSLNTVASDSALLDSVIAKAKTAIVLHDLRNDWIDNMYMLWGASFYFQKNFDSAYQMFQFINYAFADKEADGYYKYIGSRMDGNTSGSVATKENNSLAKRITSEPPSRNAAFIWQIRTMIQQNAMPEAGSLIKTLKNDPLFPARLKGALEEVQALWFYRQGTWDSAAFHLVNALGEAKTKQEKARWEYLAGQLFESKSLNEQAKDYYSRSIAHTTDPVMDIYARLNLIRINKEGGDDYIDRNIEQLLKMARRDKFEEYRDVIYSMAAQMELERGNLAAAQQLLLKASKYKTSNVLASNRAYMQLADLAFARRDYRQARSFYDSLKVQDLQPAEADRINQRKEILARLNIQNVIVDRQDSLQRVVAMPEAERTDYIKKLVRQLRRQQGLKEEDRPTGGSTVSTTIPDPFAENQSKGDWYFYNKNLKSTGLASFKQVWGTRPNIDNWRRFTAVTAQLQQNTLQGTGRGVGSNMNNVSAFEAPSYDVLFNRLPFTPGTLQKSNDSIKNSLGVLALMYVNELEDYASAIETYEDIRRRFPRDDLSAEALFQLSYSYTKTGDKAKAEETKKDLLQKYPADRRAIIAATGKDPLSTKPSPAATKTYEGIYDLFLEGKFKEAKAAKQQADSTYKTNYWSPQLLYIEAVYHIKQKEDSVARNVLMTLIRQNKGTPVAARAENLMEVLGRRKQIEEELTRLQIVRTKEDSLYVEPMPVRATIQKRDTVVSKPADVVATKPVVAKAMADTAFKKPVVKKPGTLFTYKTDAPYFAVIVLNKVDPVFGNEARNAFNRYNKEKFYNLPLEVKQVAISDDIKLLLIGNFTNIQGAVDYVQKTKPVSASQIVPWLKGDKFSFSIITQENL